MGGEQMEANFEQVGKAFIQHYYQAFDSNRATLADLYQGESMSVPPSPSPVHPLFLCKHGRKKHGSKDSVLLHIAVLQALLATELS